MPNRPRKDNPARAIRISDDLWSRAKARARERGEGVSEVVRRALEGYASEPPACTCKLIAGRPRRVHDPLCPTTFWRGQQKSVH